MKALIVIICVIAAVALFLRIPVCIYFRYADRVLTADLKYLFFFKAHAEAGIYDGEFKIKLPKREKKKKRMDPKKKTDISNNKTDKKDERVPDKPTEKKKIPVPEDELADKEKYPDFEGVDITYLKDENENKDNEDETAPKKRSLGEKLDEFSGKIDRIKLVWNLCEKDLIGMLPAFRIVKTDIRIITAGSDAANAAIKYGVANTIVWNVIASLKNILQLQRTGQYFRKRQLYAEDHAFGDYPPRNITVFQAAGQY